MKKDNHNVALNMTKMSHLRVHRKQRGTSEYSGAPLSFFFPPVGWFPDPAMECMKMLLRCALVCPWGVSGIGVSAGVACAE